MPRGHPVGVAEDAGQLLPNFEVSGAVDGPEQRGTVRTLGLTIADKPVVGIGFVDAPALRVLANESVAGHAFPQPAAALPPPRAKLATAPIRCLGLES